MKDNTFLHIRSSDFERPYSHTPGVMFELRQTVQSAVTAGTWIRSAVYHMTPEQMEQLLKEKPVSQHIVGFIVDMLERDLTARTLLI